LFRVDRERCGKSITQYQQNLSKRGIEREKEGMRKKEREKGNGELNGG